jgi:hypothetical protein
MRRNGCHAPSKAVVLLLTTQQQRYSARSTPRAAWAYPIDPLLPVDPVKP